MPGSTQTTDAQLAPGDPPLDLARAGFDAVQGDPDVAARQLLAVVTAGHASDRAKALALWGLGRLGHNAGRFDDAVDRFEQAIAVATRAGLDDDLAGIRISAAVTFQTIGRVERALEELDLAEPLVRGPGVGRWAGQRALVLLNLGRPLDAVHGFDRAVDALAAPDDRAALARTLLNRSVAHMQRGAMTSARSDLQRAHELAGSVGEHLVAAGALHNLGHLDGRLGRYPSALAAFDAARATYRRLGSPARLLAALDADHCEVLLNVGLAPEALEVADGLVRELGRSGDVLQLGEARLQRARALSILGRHRDAAHEAAVAEELLAANDRQAWAAMAAYVGAVATASTAESAAAVPLAPLAALADRLDAVGWRAEAAEVRVVHGRLAIERGDVDAARDQLALASRARPGSSVDVRAQAALATALLRLADGRPAAALMAARRGLDIVDAQRSSVGSRELRAAASAVGVPLVDVGLRVAIEAGRPATVLRWAERGRAVAMSTPPATPPDDAETAEALAELRALHLARADSPAVEARIAQVERQILRRRRLDPGAAGRVDGPASAAQLRRALGGGVLVEHVAYGGRLWALVVHGRRTTLRELAPLDMVATATQHLQFSLRRLSLSDGDRSRAAIRSFECDAADLDDLLLAPLALPPSATGLVIVPTGALHDVPWTALPTVRRHTTTIAPSATIWLRGAASPAAGPAGPVRPETRVVLVAGPDLAHAPDELDRVAALHPGAAVLNGAHATVARTLELAEGADVVHIAAHGHVRADRPMFSSLRLVDGPLGVHDLERLARAPRTVVLTACEAGRSVVGAGDELLGTAAALLSLGVRTVVAPVVPVADRAAADFAVDLHRGLAAQRPASAALRTAVDAARAAGDAASLAVASSFQCIGTA